jgi:hypothetical protein
MLGSGVADSCTIICRASDYEQRILDEAKKLANFKVSFEGEEDDWTQAILVGPSSTLEVSPLIFRGFGDDFSNASLGLYSHFGRVKTAATERKQYILDHIDLASLIVCVVAEPGFKAAEGHFEFLHALADSLDGLIYDGTGMRDSLGKVYLSNDGSFEA